MDFGLYIRLLLLPLALPQREVHLYGTCRYVAEVRRFQDVQPFLVVPLDHRFFVRLNAISCITHTIPMINPCSLTASTWLYLLMISTVLMSVCKSLVRDLPLLWLLILLSLLHEPTNTWSNP